MLIVTADKEKAAESVTTGGVAYVLIAINLVMVFVNAHFNILFLRTQKIFMKTYSETINYLAKQKYHLYMGGANDCRVDGTDLVAFIFYRKEDQVLKDIEEQYEEHRN